MDTGLAIFGPKGDAQYPFTAASEEAVHLGGGPVP